MVGIIVQDRRAGIAGAERIENVVERHLAMNVGRSAAECVGERASQQFDVVVVAAEGEVVRNQRVQTVNRGELLGDRVRRRIVLLRRIRDAA